MGVNNGGWSGKGDIKFFIDGNKKFPTICGTGTEDYFCSAYDFDCGTVDGHDGRCFPQSQVEFHTPWAGLPQAIQPDDTYQSQQQFGL